MSMSVVEAVETEEQSAAPGQPVRARRPLARRPQRARPLFLLHWLTYAITRFVFAQTMRIYSLNPQHLRRPGGYVLAVTHVSHLEVTVAAVMSRRRIRWIARKEFYRNRFASWLLDSVGCVKVNRQGVPVSSIRSAISLARDGQVVGIFPEGGVVSGQHLAFRGGPVKRGMCSVAIRAGVPIVPCVILGTEKLNGVRPWLPFLRGRLWVAAGEPIYPPEQTLCTREHRRELAEKVQASFRQLYQQLQKDFDVRDEDVP